MTTCREKTLPLKRQSLQDLNYELLNSSY